MEKISPSWLENNPAIILILLSLFILFFVLGLIFLLRRLFKLPSIDYRYEDLKVFGERLWAGETIQLEGIISERHFIRFLIEINFIHPGIKRHIIFRQGDHGVVFVKLKDRDFSSYSELS